MFKDIGRFFGFGDTTDTTTNITVLFDYKTQSSAYLSRCKPILEQMIDFGLVHKLEQCNTVEEFGNPSHFKSFDLDDVNFARPMLSTIISNPLEIPITSKHDLKQIVKIIMKKYLIEKSIQTKQSKVYIEVLVPGFKKIQVVSYANETKSGEPMLKDAGGSIEQDESPKMAGVRELQEELGIIIDQTRLVLLQSTEKFYKFQLVLDEQEYEDYIKIINKLDIDPEITMICLVNI